MPLPAALLSLQSPPLPAGHDEGQVLTTRPVRSPGPLRALEASCVPPFSALLFLTVSTSALSQRLILGLMEPALPARTESWPEVSGVYCSPATLIGGQEI